mmetsp:Transcript_4552/g.8350  ORF Transcript_4552/g.8350 Transcript_4552/m.8350 type:complete len:450 (+) Transcript_4552:766-2115(+)|eukprot:CAMPEP_0184708652 /NCGR_PEP_ID=MMETSP0313-20130426/37882_1 /TAXON_ID=2792 /ORGANISM="Porphyridium aerugineum, Strain SAG 1380-2" /LENGTH=449 /DNA_ID=CAMNT_0027170249 /DNA_START=747 /DNA_END=2096 /DNA_ORIENTATION=+
MDTSTHQAGSVLFNVPSQIAPNHYIISGTPRYRQYPLNIPNDVVEHIAVFLEPRDRFEFGMTCKQVHGMVWEESRVWNQILYSVQNGFVSNTNTHANANTNAAVLNSNDGQGDNHAYVASLPTSNNTVMQQPQQQQQPQPQQQLSSASSLRDAFFNSLKRRNIQYVPIKSIVLQLFYNVCVGCTKSMASSERITSLGLCSNCLSNHPVLGVCSRTRAKKEFNLSDTDLVHLGDKSAVLEYDCVQLRVHRVHFYRRSLKKKAIEKFGSEQAFVMEMKRKQKIAERAQLSRKARASAVMAARRANTVVSSQEQVQLPQEALVQSQEQMQMAAPTNTLLLPSSPFAAQTMVAPTTNIPVPHLTLPLPSLVNVASLPTNASMSMQLPPMSPTYVAPEQFGSSSQSQYIQHNMNNMKNMDDYRLASLPGSSNMDPNASVNVNAMNVPQGWRIML